LTDSVRCTEDSAHRFTCEVELDSDFESLTCEAADAERAASGAPPQPRPAPPPGQAPAPATGPAPPGPVSPASSPGVSRLVSTFVSRTAFSVPAAPLVTGAALVECASSEAGVVLAAAGRGKSVTLAALTMFKAALDLGHCLADARDRAAQRNAEEFCASRGGTVVGAHGDTATCEVRKREQ